jgi:hypothetical protein
MDHFPSATPEQRIDLSEDLRFFLDLLDNTHLWRERLVRDLRFANKNHVRTVSSYQIDFPPALLEKFNIARSGAWANVLVPLTTRPKAPLRGFALSGPGRSPATLTSRASIAALQAEYLRALVDSSTAAGELRSHIDPQLFESICVFTPRFFRDSFFRDGDGDFSLALADYLTSGLEIAISPKDVRQWRGKTTEAGRSQAIRSARQRRCCLRFHITLEPPPRWTTSPPWLMDTMRPSSRRTGQVTTSSS